MLAFAEQLKPPPQHGGGRDLAGVQPCGPLLPLPADAKAEVDPVRRLPGEALACFGREPGGHGRGQRPRQHRQPGPPRGQHRGACGGPVVRVPGHPGVVEDEHAAGVDAGGAACDVASEFGRRDAGQAAIGVIKQRDAGYPEFGGRTAQLSFPRAMQVGARLVQRGRSAVGVAHDVHIGASLRELVNDRAQAEALIVGVGDHHQHARPGRQPRPGPAGAPVTRSANAHDTPPVYP